MFVLEPKSVLYSTVSANSETENQNPQQGLISKLVFMWQRQKQRYALACLEEHLLQDIGVTREQAEKEAKKKFWQH